MGVKYVPMFVQQACLLVKSLLASHVLVFVTPLLLRFPVTFHREEINMFWNYLEVPLYANIQIKLRVIFVLMLS